MPPFLELVEGIQFDSIFRIVEIEWDNLEKRTQTKRRGGKIKEDFKREREREENRILDLLDRDITFNCERRENNRNRDRVQIEDRRKVWKGTEVGGSSAFFFLFRGDTVGPAPLGGSWHPEVSSARILTDLSSQYELPSPQPGCFCPRELSRRFSSPRSSSASVSGLHRLSRNSWNRKSRYLRNGIECVSKFMVKFTFDWFNRVIFILYFNFFQQTFFFPTDIFKLLFVPISTITRFYIENNRGEKNLANWINCFGSFNSILSMIKCYYLSKNGWREKPPFLC